MDYRQGLSALALVLLGCGGPPAPKAAVERTFHLDPLTGLVAAPRLTWLIDATPRALYEQPGLAVALDELLGGDRMKAFTRRHGGLDPRTLQELVYARFEPPANRASEPDAELYLGRGYVPVAALERAELAGLPYVRQHAREPSGFVHIEGRAENHPIDVLLFGHQGLAWADDAALPAKIARAFAEDRLEKTKPALASGPLAEAAQALGGAGVRVFAARPEQSFARDGLFEHFEALAFAVSTSDAGSTLALRIVAVGAFGGREREVESRVQSRLARLDGSRVGALLALASAPPWSVRAEARIVTAERRVQAAAFLHGLHLATGTDTAELFAAP